MSNPSRHLHRILALAVLAPACTLLPDTDQGDDAGPQATMATLTGTVRDADGNALADVAVEHGGGSTTTNASGTFSIEAEPGAPAVIILRKDGFVRGLERVDVSAATPTNIEVTMIAMAPAIPFDSSAGGSVMGMRGATMTAPANAFRTRDGVDVTGMVDVHLTALDPSDRAELAAYPGDGLAVDAGGETITLESFGVLDVTVVQDGLELDIREGAGVDIEVPLPAAMAAEPPETIALWGFDDEAGVWIEEGLATLDRDRGVYEGTIGHLSPWNCDQPMSATCISGRVVDSNGDAVAGAYVLANGVDYAGNSSAVADDRGDFCVPVRKDSQVEVVVYHPGGGRIEQQVASGSDDTDIPPTCSDPRCLHVGEFVIEDPGETGGWDESCSFGDDAALDITVSGAYDQSIRWSGDPWLGVCGGIAGAGGSGSVGLFFLNDTITDSPLDIYLSIEADPGATGRFPLELILAEDLLAGQTSGMWLSDGENCTAELTVNEPVAPGLFSIVGTGTCSAPLPAYPEGEAIAIEGAFSFSGVVLFGDAGSETLLACCYGPGVMPGG